MTKKQVIHLLLNNPYLVGKKIGFKDFTETHNKWIIDMVKGKGDKALQAHRNSYKTSCVSLALAIIIVVYPKDKTLFIRKTDTDVKEVIRQVKKILETPLFQVFAFALWGVSLKLTTDSQTEINTNLATGIQGTSQLVGMGLGGSLTGKHFDRIFTDDIVNLKDRVSKAEREETKRRYQELQNIKKQNGRIFNTGTPWHKEDCFSIMPEAERHTVYETGIIPESKIEELKKSMTHSLFAANYELRHISEDDVIFVEPVTGADRSLAEQGIGHIDAAYGGEDNTAFTICNKKGNKYYVFGKLWQKHIDDVEDEIIKYRQQFNAGKIYCEDNGDKGYLAKDLRKKGERVVTYHENMNKYIKITTYLKGVWSDVIFVDGTDKEYIEQICDYNENAEHDDAPDSLASLVRRLWNKKDEEYISIIG